MTDGRGASVDRTEAASVAEDAAIERLAALDDRLAGHPSAGLDAAMLESRETGAGDPSPRVHAAVDTILLLRQVAAAERDALPEPIILPQRIGRYEIIREAGRGAFAYVLEAQDDMLHRRVALKVARPEALVSVPFRRRFIREAELAARLIHPHIVAIHEVGEESGIVFIASEYCSGGDLADWLTRHPGALVPRHAADMVRSLAAAAAHAHASGIVHRDIKPANVLLVPRSGATAAVAGAEVPITDMIVKLGDFGLGKLFHEHVDEELTQLTRTGSRLGTPAWMAPEQIDRSFGEVGPATDVHALGLLLDRLLTGRCLFGGKTEAEIFRAVLLEEVVAADRVAPGVPRELAAVCLKCLAKQPADRYASAAELAADLSRFLSGMPTLARPLSAPRRAARAVLRRPLFSLVTVAAIGGLVLAGWATRQRSREAEKLAAGREEMSRLEAAAELRRGFEAWRTGNAVAAVEHLRSCARIDDALAGSLAGRWLLARLHGERDTLLAPADPVPPQPDLYCFTFARDGSAVVAGGADGRVVILRLSADGRAAGPPLVIDAHDEVNDVAISPDGRLVASAGEDGRLCVWTMADGTSSREVYHAPEPLFAAAFSPDGDRVACGGGQQSLYLLSTASGKECQPMRPFTDLVADGALSADADIETIQFVGDEEVAVACGRIVAVVDLASGRSRIFSGHDGTVGQLAVSRDGGRLLSGGTDREPRVWEVATGRLLLTLPRHPSWVQGGDFSEDGRAIATGCRDGVIRIFDAATGAQERKLVGHLGRTWDVKFSPTGLVASAGADGTLRQWSLTAAADTSGMREIRVADPMRPGMRGRGSRSAVGIVDPPSGGRTVVLQLEGRTVFVDAASGNWEEVIAPSSKESYNIAVDGQRSRFAAVAAAGPIELHSLPTRSSADRDRVAPADPFLTLPGIETGQGKDVDWTPSGMLIAGCDGGRLLAWERSLERAVEVDTLERTVDAVRVAPAGPARLAIAAGKVVRVYPLPESGPPLAREGRTLVSLPPEAGLVVKVAWSPDGMRLAYGTNDGHVATIDAARGATISVFPKHAREVAGIVWSTDGRTLVTADAECVRFSDVATTMTLDEVHPGWIIEDMEFSGPGGDGVGPMLVIAGSASVASRDGERGVRVGIFDLHRSLRAERAQP